MSARISHDLRSNTKMPGPLFAAAAGQYQAMRIMRYDKGGQPGKSVVENPSIMIVYNGTCPEGEIEDWGRGDIRAFVGVGEDRVAIGTHPDRRTAMRAVSAAAEARERVARPAPYASGLPG
jgi:hypothetical protein